MVPTETTSVERAEAALLNMLATGRIQPGQRLVESRLAGEMDLSRNAVREALNRLVASELVEYVPYSGYRLRAFDAGDLLELLELREAIEPIAARDAADVGDPALIRNIEKAYEAFHRTLETGDKVARWRSDCDFHFAVVLASGNRRFVRIYQQFRVEASLMAWAFGHEAIDHEIPEDAVSLANARETQESHEAILLAIRKRRPFEARDLAAEHIFYAKDTFLRRHLPRLTKQGLPTTIHPAPQ